MTAPPFYGSKMADKGTWRRAETMMAALTVPLLMASCASLPSSIPGGGHPVRGNARYQGAALAGALITAKAAGGTGAGTRETASGPDGSFTLLLPAGSWDLGGGASGPGGEGLFALWGGNPLELEGEIPAPGPGMVDEGINLAFLTDPGPPARREDPGIGGRVLLDGRPVEGVTVFAYLAGSPHKGPPYLAAAPTGPDGVFDLPLEPGRYDLVARRRAGASGPAAVRAAGGAPGGAGTGEGPMRKGDLSGTYPHGPVTLRQGQGLALDIPVTEIKKPREGGKPAPGQAIVLSGVIRGPGGGPVPGARVLLYPSGAMAGRPAFISAPADGKGAFTLEAGREGRFFMAARQRIGAPPESGDLTGSYDGSDDHSLVLKWGQRVEGIVIEMEPVP
jgi:hypothetical protein